MYKIGWAEENSIVHVELSQEITIDELRILYTELIQNYLDTAKGKVHLIVSGGKVTKLPPNVAEITRIFRDLPRHAHIGITVYVELLNPIMSFLANVVSQIVGQNYKTSKSVPEAIAVLKTLVVH
jgi:hypothetical protein